MAEQHSITAEILDASAKAVAIWLADDDRPSESNGVLASIAQAALEAAGVAALLAERDGLRERVAELEAAAEHFRSCRECAESFPCDEGEAHARAMEAIND
jgi:hypothetical protein